MDRIQQILLLLLIVILFSACGREGEQQSNALPDSIVVTFSPLLIDEKGVGEFHIGEHIPVAPEDKRLSISRVRALVEAEGEQIEELWYVVKSNGTEFLRILPAYDPELEEYGDIAVEIRIISPQCVTSDSARVGSTVEQLAAHYRTLTFWYTYVSNRFVADTPDLPGVQFEIEGRGFIGARDDLSDTDIVFLSRSDFRPDTRINAIRILGEM